MNGTDNYLLDTCFVLGLYGENADAIGQMNGVDWENCSVIIITEIELLGYSEIKEKDEQELTEFLNNIQIFPLSQSVKNKAIQLRKRHKIKLPDCIVLATALAENRQLLTLDNGLRNKFLKEISH